MTHGSLRKVKEHMWTVLLMKSWQIDYTLQQVVQVNDFPLQDHSAKWDTINEHVEMFNPHVPVFYAKWDIV